MASTFCCAGVRRHRLRRGARALLLAGLAGLAGSGLAADARESEARCLLRQGQLRLALDGLQAAHAQSTDPVARARAAAALGGAQLQLQRLEDAARLLAEATAGSALAGAERASALMDLGQAQAALGDLAAADASWRAAAAADSADAGLALAAQLNRLRLQPAAARVPALQALAPQIGALPAAAPRARLWLNLAAQAAEAAAAAGDTQGADGVRALTAQALASGRADALAAGDARLAAEAYDGLAALSQQGGRAEEALRWVELGIAQARRVDARELLASLEGRAGRLTHELGQDERSLQAFDRAVGHVEAVRSDIPVRYVDGRSSFRDTLEPLYLGLTDQLLRRAARSSGTERDALLRRARDTVELIKQTELEDYLRDRCSVGAAARRVVAPPPGVAIHYPILLPDRVELLLETSAGLERRSVPLPSERLRDQVLAYVAALRSGHVLRARSEALYRVLLAPLDRVLAEQRIHTLVTVPDGVLRLLPLASLHDGRGWLLQRLAVATAPGLSLTPASAAAAAGGPPPRALVAGLSEPGPVVAKLSAEVIETVLDPLADSRQPRRRGGAGPAEPAPPPDAARQRELRSALALPGVKDEVESIARVLPGSLLLDRDFTLEALRQNLRQQRPGIVHIASHGVFGDSADTTFIMTYDELLTLDGLQALLRGDRAGQAPIEVLTLSACQTAEGDDRAPLGMSGTALKARARTALGTLWPVSDEAANQVMQGFYRRLAAGGDSRVQALRKAQLELMQQPRRQHPQYWAAFILIGDWQ